MTPEELAELVSKLGVDISATASRQHATEKAVATLTRQLTKVMNSFATLQERTAKTPEESEDVTPEWLTLTDPRLAADVLVRTWTWVKDVWLHSDPELPPCWPIHPRVVEDLRAAHATWDMARKTPAGPGLMTGWLVQVRKPITEGIRLAMPHCDADQHRDDSTMGRKVRFQLADPPELTLVEVAEWWTSYHDVTIPAPGLIEVPL